MEYRYGYTEVEDYLLEKESGLILDGITEGDSIVHISRQKKISGTVISPSVIITTLKNIIIINRWAGGVKSDITYIPYSNIASVRISNGVLLSSLFIRVKGSASGAETIRGRTEGMIRGLKRAEAERIFKHVNSIIHRMHDESGEKHYHMDGTINNVYVNEYKAGESAYKYPEEPAQIEDYEFEQKQESIRYLTHKDPDEYVHVPPSMSNFSVNNIEPNHKVTADDLLIFKVRKARNAQLVINKQRN